jgi:hypothetical protein
MKTIQLTQGYKALVDDEDYVRVTQFKWHASVDKRKDGTIKTVYAKRNVGKADGTRTTERLHYFILGIAGVDHEDHNGLNNQRHNLRPATGSENQHNRGKNRNSTSGYKGVTWNKHEEKWQARIQANGRKIQLGYFTDLIDAKEAAEAGYLKHHGRFALTERN